MNYEELTITNNFLFCRIFSSRPDLTKGLLERILSVKIGRVHIPQPERPIELRPGGRGVRLDIYLEDDADTVYDIEMQCTDQEDLPKRVRYYQSMIDGDLLDRGQPFYQLRNSIVLFICCFDPLGKGLAKYTIQPLCSEDFSLRLDDGRTIIFINVSGFSKDLPEDLQKLLSYFSKGIPDDAFTDELEQAVSASKNNQGWKEDYMKLETFLEVETRAARKKAREEGRAEGRAEGEALFSSLVQALMQDGRTDDVLRAATDPAFRHGLYKEYDIF